MSETLSSTSESAAIKDPPMVSAPPNRKPTGYFYIAKMECGCVCASAVDSEKSRSFIADDVAEWIRSGLTVERITREEWRANVSDNFGKCVHGTLKARHEAFVARRKIPLDERLTDIAMAWLKEQVPGGEDEDRGEVLDSIKAAVESAGSGPDAFLVCYYLKHDGWWDADADLCRKFDNEISLTES